VVAGTALLELDESVLETLELDGLVVQRIHLHGPPPYYAAKLGDQEYRYEKSFPIKGHGASLPRFLRQQIEAGNTPLIVERTDRFYVYLTV
jgi:hypothetical protein